MHWQFGCLLSGWLCRFSGWLCRFSWVSLGRHTDRHCMQWGGGGVRAWWRGGCGRWPLGWGLGGWGQGGFISVRWWTVIWSVAGSCPTGTPSGGQLSWSPCGPQPLLGSGMQCSILTEKEKEIKNNREGEKETERVQTRGWENEQGKGS